jgi:3-carboxy-cis,cis-muconate cycloisomerase
MGARLMESLATTEPLAEIFSDRSVLTAMLAFESALARSQARFNLIPASAADAIAAAADAARFDPTTLARGALLSGTPAIPLVKALTEQVGMHDPVAAGFVHWGATSQDVCDTAMVLLLKKAQTILDADLQRLEAALRRLATKNRHAVMLSRTLLQPAPPTTFGLKAAGWLASIHRSRGRLRAAFVESLILQFGGASGTLASFGEQGVAVGHAVAEELHLTYPEAPWHAHRDRLAGLVCSCGVLGGVLGKMGRDISLLMQGEIAEASEPGGSGRGGSSAMPHKRNPVGCALTLAAADRLPGLVAGFLSCMVQEHERALGGWQAEWPIISSAIQTTGLAAACMAEVAEGLTVDQARMRANIAATRGIIFSERAAMFLGKKIGRAAAHRILEEATRRSVEQGRRLSDVLGEMPEAKDHLDASSLNDLDLPEHYLGAACEFQDRQLAAVEEDLPAKLHPKEE